MIFPLSSLIHTFYNIDLLFSPKENTKFVSFQYGVAFVKRSSLLNRFPPNNSSFFEEKNLRFPWVLRVKGCVLLEARVVGGRGRLVLLPSKHWDVHTYSGRTNYGELLLFVSSFQRDFSCTAIYVKIGDKL